MVGLRGGTARQSRPRGSVLGSAASRCVGFNPLPHSLTAFFLVRTFSFRFPPLLSSDALRCVSSSLFIFHLLRSVVFSFLFFSFFSFVSRFPFFLFDFASSFPTSLLVRFESTDSRASLARKCRYRWIGRVLFASAIYACVTQSARTTTSRRV